MTDRLLGLYISPAEQRAYWYIASLDEDNQTALTWLGEPPANPPAKELLMPARAKFRTLPKENALFEDDEYVAPRQRSFLPPEGDASGRFPQPIPLAEPPHTALPMDQLIAEEENA